MTGLENDSRVSHPTSRREPLICHVSKSPSRRDTVPGAHRGPVPIRQSVRNASERRQSFDEAPRADFTPSASLRIFQPARLFPSRPLRSSPRPSWPPPSRSATSRSPRTTYASLSPIPVLAANGRQLLNKDFYHTQAANLEIKSKTPNGVV